MYEQHGGPEVLHIIDMEAPSDPTGGAVRSEDREGLSVADLKVDPVHRSVDGEPQAAAASRAGDSVQP